MHKDAVTFEKLKEAKHGFNMVVEFNLLPELSLEKVEDPKGDFFPLGGFAYAEEKHTVFGIKNITCIHELLKQVKAASARQHIPLALPAEAALMSQAQKTFGTIH